MASGDLDWPDRLIWWLSAAEVAWLCGDVEALLEIRARISFEQTLWDAGLVIGAPKPADRDAAYARVDAMLGID